MNIITMTVNPARDVHISCDSFAVGKDNPAKLLRSDTGGKGINVSRALYRAGVDNLCYLLLGSEDGAEFVKPLQEMGLHLLYRTVDGPVRVNYNVHSLEGETVIATDGPSVDAQMVHSIEQELSPLLSKGDVLSFNGRLSSRTDKDALMDMLARFGDRGVRLVLDSKSVNLRDVITLKPFLVKPNKDELEELFGVSVNSVAELYRMMKVLSDGGVENVLVSLGSDGAALLCSEGFFVASAPSVTVVSTVGAGDSMIGGFLAAFERGASAQELLCSAIAFGSAACLTEGTLPPAPEDVRRLMPLVDVRREEP